MSEYDEEWVMTAGLVEEILDRYLKRWMPCG